MKNQAFEKIEQLGPEPMKTLGAILNHLPMHKKSFTRDDVLENLELSDMMSVSTQRKIEELTTNKHHPKIVSCARARIDSLLKSGLIERTNPRTNTLAIYEFTYPTEDLKNAHRAIKELLELSEIFQTAYKKLQKDFETAAKNGDTAKMYGLKKISAKNNQTSLEIDAHISRLDPE